MSLVFDLLLGWKHLLVWREEYALYVAKPLLSWSVLSRGGQRDDMTGEKETEIRTDRDGPQEAEIGASIVRQCVKPLFLMPVSHIGATGCSVSVQHSANGKAVEHGPSI